MYIETALGEPIIHSLQGTIYDVHDKYLTNVIVKAFDKDLRSEKLLGQAITDVKGHYLIQYTVADLSRKGKLRADLFIAVFNNKPPTKKQIAKSGIHFKAPIEYVLDFKTDGTTPIGLSEYDSLLDIIRPLVKRQNLKIANLKEDENFSDISFISGETGEDETKIRALQVAFAHAKTTSLPAEIFYALIRRQFPVVWDELFLTSSESQTNQIMQAIELNIISSELEKKIPVFIKTLNQHASTFVLNENKDSSEFKRIIGASLPQKELQKTFVDTYFSNESKPEQFWDKLALEDGFKDGKAIEKTKNILRLNLLTEQPELAVELHNLQARDPELKELSGYAKLTRDDFTKYINKLVSSGKLKEFPAGIKGDTVEEKTKNYANALEQRVSNIFPTMSFKSRLATGNSPAFADSKNNLIKFFSENPDFDLTTTKINKVIEAANFQGIQNSIKLKKQIKTIHRLHRLTPKYEDIELLLDEGLDSASAVVRNNSKQQFVKRMEGKIAQHSAEKIYTDAHLLDRRSNIIALNSQIKENIPTYAINGTDYQSMFGDNFLCNCEHCQSIYSPAAYLVDVLNFIRNNDENAFELLTKERRPDIDDIFLNCENTNTLLPYIDLVNEVLEGFIAESGIGGIEARQTTHSAEELAAYPEHVNSAVYATLRDSFSSFQLPINLPLEETRIYLDKLDCQRYKLMELFHVNKDHDKYQDIAIAAEYLALSQQELAVINGTKPVAKTVTGKVSDFLQQIDLSYIELLQLLECYFINPLNAAADARSITIVADAVDNDDPATCNLQKLNLVGLNASVAKRIIRFIRLWKKLGWNIFNVDRALKALNIDKESFSISDVELNNKLIIPLSHIARISEQFGLDVPAILTLWSNIDTTEYIDRIGEEQSRIPSLYEKLFQNKQVSNPLDSDFEDSDQLPGKLAAKSTLITAVCNISESDFNLESAPWVNADLTLDSLSTVYRHSVLAQKLNISIERLLELIKLTGMAPFGDSDNTLSTLNFIDKIQFIKGSGFSAIDLNKLLKQDPSNVTPIDNNSISTALTALREELHKIALQFPNAEAEANEMADKLLLQNKVIVDSLTVAFDTESRIVAAMLKGLVKSTADNTLPAISLFIGNDFIESEDVIASVGENDQIVWQFPDLVNTYRVLSETSERLLLLIDKLSISTEEFIFFQSNEAVFNIEGIWSLPTSTTGNEQYAAFENLVRLIDFRNTLPKLTEDWFTLFNIVIENKVGAKKEFIDALAELSQASVGSLEFLFGSGSDTTDKGILNYSFPENYNNGQFLLYAMDCIKKAEGLGTTVELLFPLTAEEIEDKEAKVANNILKAKYDDASWLDIIQPISNQLRERKRDALVSYILTSTALKFITFRNANSIFDSSALYAFFLIDTEMSSCMMTSRIKQAISSVQLFIDRSLMGLESNVSLQETFASQWNEWRKIYRVWQANREVLVKPENYIEPNLRDDKSPFFKELESKLTQNDITDDIAKDALLEYLEKLDTVANLEVIGFFPDKATGIMHVVGRSETSPHQYFYRTQKQSVWSAWETVELDIEGDHILPVVWNNRLILFWASFTEKQVPNNKKASIKVPTNDSEGEIKSEEAEMFFEIKLNWSEYKSDKWGARKVSDKIIKKNSNLPFLRSFVDQDGGLYIRLFEPEEYTGSEPEKVKEDLVYTLAYSTVNFDNPSLNITNNTAAFRARAPGNGLGRGLPGDNDNILPDVIVVGELAPTEDPIRDTFHFDNCNSSPNTVDGRNIIKGLSSTKVKGAKLKYPFLKKTGGLSITGPGLNKEYLGSPDISIFDGPQRETFQLLPSHHENIDSFQFFYRNKNNNFYVSHAASPAKWLRNIMDVRMFYHPYVCDYIKTLNSNGIDALYTKGIQQQENSTVLLTQGYIPTNKVGSRPKEEVDFSVTGAYSLYNWELFFHIPLLIATRLTQNQKFSEARTWLHYIFDPTGTQDSSNEGVERFWITKPFDKEIKDGVLSIEELINNEDPSEFKAQLRYSEENPFNPHGIARFRHSSYMRVTVMKYIDNLIAWADQLFRRDSIESINEATLLYVLAANLLGEKPESIPARAKPIESSFNTVFDAVQGSLDNFLEAKVAIQSFISPSDSSGIENSDSSPLMSMFCIPKNNKLLGYWDTVADRLFKIRYCMNIEGVVRQLRLFEPRIDPALLVRAKAQGLDLNSVLNDLHAPLPYYRYQVMLQKANELCNDVKALGSQLLSVLEKRDAEELSLLRSGQEIKLLAMVRDIKVKQRDESKKSIQSLNASRNVTLNKYNYFDSKEYRNDSETHYFYSTQSANAIQGALHLNYAIASLAYLSPKFKIGSGFTFGSTFGGENFARAAKMTLEGSQSLANFLRTAGEMSNINATYQRRKEEWNFQAKTAQLELKQIDKQILAAEIRQAITEKDLESHDQQVENTKAIDDYMRSKFTNQELYDDMVKQVSSVYFQSYQLAYDLAKKAEKCFQYELGQEEKLFIKFGYWDSLKKGLLSGEKLQYDLRRLDIAYLENNQREYELTKHISLSMLDPFSLVKLRVTGKCEFEVPEVLFDMDYSGQYFRRIKSVSVSLPCIAGPYTSVSAKLTLVNSRYRKHGTSDSEFVEYLGLDGADQSIGTSNAQNDSGVFELNFNGERYLPFERLGAIGRWQLELPAEVRQFDYKTISDAVLHMKYTALEGETELKNSTKASLKEQLDNIEQELGEQGLHTAVNLKYDLANEWHLLKQNATVDLTIDKSRLPYLAQSLDNTKIEKVTFVAKVRNNPASFGINVGLNNLALGRVDELKLCSGDIDTIALGVPFTLSVDAAQLDNLEDLIMLVKYSFLEI